MAILFWLCMIYDSSSYTVKGFWVKERILLRYFSVPASLQTCVRNQGTAWIHTIDALQAWHLWDQNCLQNSSCWSYSSRDVCACVCYLSWSNQIPSNITATPFLKNSPQLSMSKFLLYITGKNFRSSRTWISPKWSNDEESRYNMANNNLPKFWRTIDYVNMYEENTSKYMCVKKLNM